MSKKFIFKLLLLGDSGVGKTSIIRRYVKNEFTFHYKATIGCDFAVRVLELENGDAVELQLWDIAGQERFGSLMGMYCRGAQGVIYVCDSQCAKTLENIPRWKQSLEDRANLLHLPSVLLVNKADLEHTLNEDTAKTITTDLHISQGWHYASACENTGIEENLLGLVLELVNIHRDSGSEMTTQDNVVLDFDEMKQEKTNTCCK